MNIGMPEIVRTTRLPSPSEHRETGCCWRIWLAVILVVGASVRVWATLQHRALGQTDAYAHLAFVRDVLETGRLGHPLYPPLYHFLLAIPCLMFGAEPYGIVRWAGAAFGAALVAAVFYLTRTAFGPRAALWSAFLIAACPLFHHIQKTGVGAYPTQLGLLMVPLLALAWLHSFDGSWRATTVASLLVIAFVGSVPWMLVGLLPWLAVDAVCRVRTRWPASARLLAGGGIILSLLGFVWLVVRVDRATLIESLRYLLGDELQGSESAFAALYRLAVSFFRPKRLWPLFSWQTLVVLLSGAVSAVSLALARQNPAARLIALGLLISWAQTAFGVLQFPLYLRAGWIFLILLASVLGTAIVVLECHLSRVARMGLRALLLGSAVVSFWMPPTPRPHLSAAEDDLALFAEELRAWCMRKPTPSIGRAGFHLLGHDDTLVLWCRPFTGARHESEPLPALIGRCPRILFRTSGVHFRGPLRLMDGRTNVVVLDDAAVPPKPSRVMMLLDPDLVASFEKMRTKLFAISGRLRHLIEGARAAGWDVHRFEYPGGLEIFFLIPSDLEGRARSAP